MAMPATADHRPIALARSFGSVNTLVRIDNVAGMTSAAPSPMTARAAISWPEVVASAPAADAAAKISSPAVRAPLRPRRSPSDPPVSSSPANTKA